MQFTYHNNTASNMSRASYAATVANPWVAQPGAIEDEFNGRTVALKVNGSFDILTNDVGNGAWAIQPHLAEVLRAGAFPPGSGDATWNPPGIVYPAQDYTALTAAYNAYRIVSVGVKATYIGGEVDAKGEISISHHQGVAAAGLAANISSYREHGAVHVQPLYEIKGPVYGACHNFDRPAFRAMGLAHYDTFPTTVVAVLGGPQAKSLVKVEYCYNLELIPIPGSLFEHLAKTSPTSATGVATARRLVPGRAGSSLGAVTRMLGSSTSKPRRKRRYKKKAFKSKGIRNMKLARRYGVLSRPLRRRVR